MRTLDPAYAAAIAGAATTLCTCWRLVRRDGRTFGFTDHDCDLTIAGLVYAARAGFDGADVEAVLGLAAGGSEASGALTGAAINETDLANGVYDGATIEQWRVDWTAPTQRLLIDMFVLGEVKRSEFAFTAELRGLASALDQERGRSYAAACDADLGDARCGVSLAGPFVAQGVVGATDGRVRITAALTQASGWFAGGSLAFTSGANAGASATLRDHMVDGLGAHLALWTPLAAPIAVGDAFTVRAGCDKSFATCRTKFANQARFRGCPHMPGNDFVLTYPTAARPDFDGGSLFR